MTMLRERAPVEVEERTRYGVEWLVGIVGGLLAAVGAFMQYGPSDGVLTFMVWDYDVAGLHEAWPMSLLIAGGVGLCAAFTLLAGKLYRHDKTMSGRVVTSGILAIAGLALAVTYAVMLII